MDKFSLEPDRHWHNQPLVRERDAGKTRWTWCAVVSMFLAAAPVGVYMWEQNECMKLDYGVEALRAEHERLVETERQLKISQAGAEDLPEIEIWATSRRGLTRPVPAHVITVRSEPPGNDPLVAHGPAGD